MLTIVNVALPSIQEDLAFSQCDLAWVVNAYMIPFGGLLLLAYLIRARGAGGRDPSSFCARRGHRRRRPSRSASPMRFPSRRRPTEVGSSRWLFRDMPL